MEPLGLDSDASFDYSSRFKTHNSEHAASVAVADPSRPAGGQATLTRVRRHGARVSHSLGGNGNGAAVLPYPEVLTLRPARQGYARVHGTAARAAKRAFDVIGAILLLVILAPVWLAIAAAIKLDSPGPVLFRQRRIGRDDGPFWMFKFRTMVDGADDQKPALLHLNEAADGLFKINGDPRITKVGAWLRSTCIDELPQLLNVVAGRMSLVGPRPLVPPEDARITGVDRSRLTMRPGMTGPWQVRGASTIPVREMVELDRAYLDDWSLWLDLRLLFRTAHLVVRRQGI